MSYNQQTYQWHQYNYPAVGCPQTFIPGLSKFAVQEVTASARLLLGCRSQAGIHLACILSGPVDPQPEGEKLFNSWHLLMQEMEYSPFLVVLASLAETWL